MLKVTYRERQYLDKYRAIDTIHTFTAVSSFTSGGLTYFRLNKFEYKTVDTDFIINVEENKQ